MFRTFLFLSLLMALVFTVNAQTNNTTSASDTILIKKKAGGYLFYQHGQQIDLKKLKEMMKVNDQAYKEIRAAQSSNIVATIFGYAGGFLIGWPIGTAIGGGKPNWTLAGVGAGLTAIVAIPFSQNAKKKAKNAASIYNSSLTALKRKNELNVNFNSNGIGVALRF